jgi:RecA-family ATPase
MSQHESISEWEARRKLLIQPPGIITAAALRRKSVSEPRFLVPQRVPAGGITLVVAPPGSTKSWLVYDLALAVARPGRRWLDSEPKHGNVLVLSYDNPTEETARRFSRLGLLDDDPIWFHSVDQNAWKMPTHAETLADICHELQPILVVVDSFRQAVNGNENSSEEMGEVMGGYKAMAATPSGPAVVVVHHAAKGIALEGAGTRGSSEIEGSADAIIAIEKGEVRWTKARSWCVPEKFRLNYELTDEGVTTRLRLKQKKAAA